MKGFVWRKFFIVQFIRVVEPFVWKEFFCLWCLLCFQDWIMIVAPRRKSKMSGSWRLPYLNETISWLSWQQSDQYLVRLWEEVVSFSWLRWYRKSQCWIQGLVRMCIISESVPSSQWVVITAFVETVLSCYRLPLQYRRSDCDVHLELLSYVASLLIIAIPNWGSVIFTWSSPCAAKLSKASTKDDTKSRGLGSLKKKDSCIKLDDVVTDTWHVPPNP